jgi:hypothetical protein
LIFEGFGIFVYVWLFAYEWPVGLTIFIEIPVFPP